MDTLVTPIANVWINKQGIVYKQVIENAHIDMDNVKISFKQTMEFTGPGKKLMLYDVRPHFTITDEAMDFLQGQVMGAHSIATAVLGKGLGIRIMADYIVHVKKLKVPLKIFENEEEAVKWLLSFKKNTKKATVKI